MLDIKFIRENKELIQEGARKKHIEFSVEELLAVDDERRALLGTIEERRAKQNSASERIAKAEGGEKVRLVADMKDLKDDLQKDEEQLKEVMKRWQTLMLQVPNIPDMSVPEGESDEDNKEERTWGAVQKLPFAPKDHVTLMQNLDMADFERGTKVAGFRGYFLKNDGARLSYAVWRFVFDYFDKKGEFTPMITPSVLRKENFYGTGYLPQGEEDLYKTQDDMYLAGTAEVSTMGYYMNEVLDAKNLPVKFFSFSPCYRREAGSHGKDTKGLVRVHEFYKFEQVVLCEANHETSVRFHEELTRHAEEMLQELELPYRVVINCGADLGLGQVKKYDIEAWVPSEGKYRETHSSSYFHDFQTRRLNIKYRDADGTLHYAHSLNNTAIATPRILVALVENNQEADGSVRVPKALVPYMGKGVITKPTTNN